MALLRKARTVKSISRVDGNHERHREAENLALAAICPGYKGREPLAQKIVTVYIQASRSAF
jgi:hypothetical protein